MSNVDHCHCQVTYWHSPSNMSANHWEAAALECEAYCVADSRCCTWTYGARHWRFMGAPSKTIVV
jgi:hypothetical protein